MMHSQSIAFYRMVILFYQYSFIANYGDRVSPGELGRINEPETA